MMEHEELELAQVDKVAIKPCYLFVYFVGEVQCSVASSQRSSASIINDKIQ